MRKLFTLIFLFIVIHSSVHSQLAVFKMVGKGSDNAKIGFGAFAFTQIPLNEIGNRNVVIELMDLAYFPQKDPGIGSVIAYLSIKVGYKYIFSTESKTGFYIEPSAGYCRVVRSDNIYGDYKDGLALAAEAGYTLEVGQRDNALNFGIKYESDRAGTNFIVNSIGLRLSYSFHLFRKRGDN